MRVFASKQSPYENVDCFQVCNYRHQSSQACLWRVLRFLRVSRFNKARLRVSFSCFEATWAIWILVCAAANFITLNADPILPRLKLMKILRQLRSNKPP